MYVGHLPRRYEEGFAEHKIFSVGAVKEVLGEAFFLVSGYNNEPQTVEYLQALLVGQHLFLQPGQKFVWRVVLNSEKRVGQVDQKNGSDLFNDVVEEQVDFFAGKVDQGQKGSFFVSEDAKLKLCLDCQVLEDFAHFCGVPVDAFLAV